MRFHSMRRYVTVAIHRLFLLPLFIVVVLSFPNVREPLVRFWQIPIRIVLPNGAPERRSTV